MIEIMNLEHGSLYVWGSNSECQLGLGGSADDIVCTPTKVTFFPSPISFVDCGNYHTAAITKGNLYVWGEASDDKLGDRFQRNQDSPQVTNDCSRTSLKSTCF